MIIRALDVDHDWTFGKGKQNYLTTQKAIAENLQTRILEFLNDCWFNLPAGIDWQRLMSQKNRNRTLQEIELDVKAVILRSFGVVRVNTIDAQFTGLRSVVVSYNIDTIYTTQFFQRTEVINA